MKPKKFTHTESVEHAGRAKRKTDTNSTHSFSRVMQFSEHNLREGVLRLPSQFISYGKANSKRCASLSLKNNVSAFGSGKLFGTIENDFNVYEC